MTRNIKPFGLRMPDDLKAYLAQQAKNNGRSLNMEIAHRLQESRKADEKKAQ